MDFSELFDQYCNRMAAVQIHARSMRSDARREFRLLVEEDERRRAANLPADYATSFQNMSFRMATTGDHFFYAFRQQSISDQMNSLKSRTNRHYQWLLAEAYEHFEDFLEQAYAVAASKDKNFWPLRDYGTFRSGDLNSLTFEKLHELARNKKDKPYSLINPFREGSSDIRKYESTNPLNVNLWFFLHLIEKLRHHIVHTKGYIEDPEKFSTDVLKKAGLYNSGKPDENYINWIHTFLEPHESRHVIYLLEQPAPSVGALGFHVNVFDEILNKLIAYAHLVASSLAVLKPKRGVGVADA